MESATGNSILDFSDYGKLNKIMRLASIVVLLVLLGTIFIPYDRVIYSEWTGSKDVFDDYTIIKYMIIPFVVAGVVVCICGSWKSIRTIGIIGLGLFAFHFFIILGYSKKWAVSFGDFLGVFRLGSYLRLLCPLAVLILAIFMIKKEEENKKKTK